MGSGVAEHELAYGMLLISQLSYYTDCVAVFSPSIFLVQGFMIKKKNLSFSKVSGEKAKTDTGVQSAIFTRYFFFSADTVSCCLSLTTDTSCPASSPISGKSDSVLHIRQRLFFPLFYHWNFSITLVFISLYCII